MISLGRLPERAMPKEECCLSQECHKDNAYKMTQSHMGAMDNDLLCHTCQRISHPSPTRHHTCSYLTQTVTCNTDNSKSPGHICAGRKRDINKCEGQLYHTDLHTNILVRHRHKGNGVHTSGHASHFTAYLLIASLLCCLPVCVVSASTFYPPLVNVAEDRPISVSPSDATCGQNNIRTHYCGSSVDSTSVTGCTDEYCQLGCADRSANSISTNAFESVASGWDDCVQKDYNELSPGSAVNAWSVWFKGNNTGQCYLYLYTAYLVPITLHPKWYLGITLWIKPQITNNERTILTIGDSEGGLAAVRIYLDSSLRVGLDNSRRTIWYPSWQIPDDQWTFLAFQVVDDSFSVHFNGSVVYPTQFGLEYLSPRNYASKFYIGRGFEDNNNDAFVGHMQNVKFFPDGITNREIEAMYSGEMEKIRVLSACRCPVQYPLILGDDDTRCVANEGPGRPIITEYRTNQLATPVQFANDGRIHTVWLSQPGTETVHLAIDLGQTLQVVDIRILFYSPLPQLVAIERRLTTSSTWSAWQYLSHDCQADKQLPPGAPLSSETDVNCKLLIPDNIPIPYTDHTLIIELLDGRPGQNNGSINQQLSSFLEASEVRIQMTGHPFVSFYDHKYHGIKEIQINSRCECNGHGIGCNMTKNPYVCTCAPESFTTGRQCTMCVDGAYQVPGRVTSDPDLCRPCDCQPEGTTHGLLNCSMDGGQCQCKPNTHGRSCDSCKPGFFNLQASNPDGCEVCHCDVTGTTSSNQSCNATTGQCECKANVMGLACDSCVEGYYNLQSSNPAGCDECLCNPAGTQDNSSACHQQSGQCNCKSHTTGLRCDACVEGTYALTIDKESGCSQCDCDTIGALNNSCDELTGQCFCVPNVIGRRCDTCSPGFYALSADDLGENGCSHRCDCNIDGTVAGVINQCEQYGGNCTCKPLVTGQYCDKCMSGAYGFSQSEDMGCLECDCDVNGVNTSNTDCDIINGQCSCKANVESRRCDTCKPNTFGLNESNPLGCDECRCYVPGMVPDEDCGKIQGKCPCIPGAGDPATTNFSCEPYVSGFSPKYGPESGGTPITIIGGFLIDLPNGNISIGPVICDINQQNSNHTHAECISRSLRTENLTSLKAQPLHMTINIAQKIHFNLTDTYIYDEDPTVTDVFPLTTIQDGGLTMTIIGSHLDSVATPILHIYMVYQKVLTTFSEDCIVKTGGTKMLCPTPAIDIPDNISTTARRKRSVPFNPAQTVSKETEKSGSAGRHVRVRRQDDLSSHKLGGGDLRFYYGFAFDGMDYYKNMSDRMPELGEFHVYKNPSFHKFTNKNHLKLYQPYWPFSHKFLRIEGERLNYAATEEDYAIDIGDQECDNIDLSTNMIVCIPPSRQPDPDDSLGPLADFQGSPLVSVKVGNLHYVVGYIEYEHTFWENEVFRYSVLGGVAGLILLTILLCVIICVCRRHRKLQKDAKHPYLETGSTKQSNNYISAYSGTDSVYDTGSTVTYMNPESDLLLLLPQELQLKLQECLIEPKRMSIANMIGQGHFGRVYLGRLYDEIASSYTEVAIKTFREFHITPRDVGQFLEEATMMKDFNHEHVLHLIGVVIDDENKAYVLIPYMQHGDMKSFISNEDNKLTVGELIQFGLQVAHGMCYLCQQKFVHRDLAARNCMVGKDKNIKIADFGLSRDIYEHDYFREGDETRPLPVKWMALESLEKRLFTTKSDVWSFGVLMWELMTRGCTPYPDVDSFDIKIYIMCGNRMDKPDFSPPEIYNLMIECWDENAENRPTFPEIASRLSKFLEVSNANTKARESQKRYVRPRSFHAEGIPLDLLP